MYLILNIIKKWIIFNSWETSFNKEKMIKFFQKQKFKKEVQLLEKNLVKNLIKQFPNLAKKYDSLILNLVMVVNETEKSILLNHQILNSKSLKNKEKKDKKYYKITGIKIFNKLKNKYVPLSLIIYENSIQYIYLSFDRNLSKEFNLKDIKSNNLKKEVLKIKNPDEEVLKKILNKISKEQLKLLNIKDTFEINLKNKAYYPILDMEDGDYVVVDKKGKVYRLIHDHKQPIKKISENIKSFFSSYSGNKKDLEVFFK